jgi:hypothetical protein
MAKRKALAPFRIPKGVPKEIRKALRLGKPGRFLSTVKALQLFDLLAFEAKRGAKRHSALVAKFETVRRPETKAKYLGLVRASQEEGGAIGHGLNQLAEAFGVEPLPPLAGPDVVPTMPGLEEPDEDFAQEEEGSLEIEFGVDYVESEGWTHPTGKGSDVSFNARIFRSDKRPLTESDAREIVAEFVRTGHMRDGIKVQTVSWQRPTWPKEKSSSQAHHLEHFLNILHRVGDGGLRIGPTKLDEM